MENTKKVATINIDGTEYDQDKLSDKAKNVLSFIQRLDTEATELRFQLDKASLARKQALIDLKEAVK